MLENLRELLLLLKTDSDSKIVDDLVITDVSGSLECAQMGQDLLACISLQASSCTDVPLQCQSVCCEMDLLSELYLSTFIKYAYSNKVVFCIR